MSKILVVRTMVCGGCTDTLFEKGTKIEDAIEFARDSWSSISEEDKKSCDTWVVVGRITLDKGFDDDNYDDNYVEAMEKMEDIFFIENEA